MAYPDWSSVEWFVYETPGLTRNGVPGEPTYRVLPRKLSGDGNSLDRKKRGEHRLGERFAAAVVGVSRATVVALLSRGVHPAALMREVGKLAEAQFARSADDRRPNAYLAQLAKQEREAEQLPVAA